MRNGDEQGAFRHHVLAVAEFTGHFHLAGNAGDVFQPVTGHHAGVIAGAAGDDLHGFYLVENRRGFFAEGLDQTCRVVDTTFQGFLDCRRLLEDFLLHVVAVFTLFRIFMGAVELVGFTGCRIAGRIHNTHAVGGDFCLVAFFKEDKAVGHWQQGQLIRCDVVFVNAQTNHQRAARTNGDQLVRFRGVNDAQCVSAIQFFGDRLHGVKEIQATVQRLVYQVDDDFRIGLGFEVVAAGFQFVFQFLKVFDDTVMHQRQITTGHVRMGIGF